MTFRGSIEELAKVAFAARGISQAQEMRIGALMAKAVARERRSPATPHYTTPTVTGKLELAAEQHILASLAHGPLMASDMLPGTGLKPQAMSNLLGIMHRQGKITRATRWLNSAAVWSLPREAAE